MKRILSMVLSACLLGGLATGCKGPGGGAEVPMGRYIEEQGEVIDGLSSVYDFHRLADGSTVFYGGVKSQEGGELVYNRYLISAEGGAPTGKAMPSLSELPGTGMRGISEAGNGTVYAAYYDENFNMRIARAKDGMSFEPFAVPDLAAQDSNLVGVIGGDGVISMGGMGMADGGDSTETPNTAPADGTGAEAPEVEAEAPKLEAEGPETDTDAEAPVYHIGNGSAGSANFVPAGNTTKKSASGILALENGDFLILYGQAGVSRYSGTDGSLLAEYRGNGFNGTAAVHGNKLLIQSTEGTELWTYDLDTAKQTGTYTYDNLNFSTRVGIDEGGVYLADNTGIYRQTEGGSIWEKLVDGDLTSLVMPNLSLSGLAPDGTGGFYGLLGSNERFQLMRYLYSAETPTNPDTELTIFSLKENNTVRQAVGEFQRRNPNVRINFRVAMADESAATAEDVIRALNTEFLSGKGPDLLLLDGLPVESYIEKGVLADISELVGGLITSQGLMKNLMNTYAKGGKIYGVPSRFTFPVMMGKTADVDQITSLEALLARVQKDQGGTIPFLRPADRLWMEDTTGMMMDYYDACVSLWTRADGSIDEAALTRYLSTMVGLEKTVKEHTPQVGGGAMSMVTMAVSAIGGGGGYEKIDMGPTDLKGGRALFHIQDMAGIFGLSTTVASLGNMEDQKVSTLFGGTAYTPKGSIGITATGKQQELARSFVEMLLSPTVQDNYLYDGYPVNENSLTKLVAETVKESEAGDMGFIAMCGTLTTPILIDQVVRDAVEGQMKGLMDGSTTPEQAAANVVEKTQLYLAE